MVTRLRRAFVIGALGVAAMVSGCSRAEAPVMASPSAGYLISGAVAKGA